MSNVKQIIQSLGAYLGDVGVEFKKISWPDRQELVDSTIVVITFIVILAVVVLCCDKTIMFFLQLIHA
ncbi:MAG: preprotein translocase subunit SecE [Kiritimatiellae bacterium]|jgi:preprotein translocase SecE subunit|nr:preprotein translocase subunit SecE [Kiritimatiellia bacterium]MDD2348442.1 preprotein translocase subunit SecE [Kiritimatiellia bacterium]MDD3584347.1 preprotein translocase subunit SecE [Kiritimatiellia bacterium]HHU14815.1 preprotein translocase subunit SecE [Lentisphaerota bacterium]HON46974.1 preprotein translocase subunit SecE [Kiritimatiellia bacterium]